MPPATGLDWCLSQDVLAGGERTEKLIVQIVAVGNHNQRRIFHVRMPNNLSSVKKHRKTFAASLRVPHNSDPASPEMISPGTIGFFPTFLCSGYFREFGETTYELIFIRLNATGGKRACQSFVHRPVLVVCGYFLLNFCTVILIHDKIQNVVEKPTLLENPEDSCFEFGSSFRDKVFAVNCPPGHESVPSAGYSSGTCLDSVGDYQKFICCEQGGNVSFICLKLVECVFDCRVFIAGIF